MLTLLVLLPLAANTAVVAGLHVWRERIRVVADEWVAAVPGAEVTDVRFASGRFRVDVRTPEDLPPTEDILSSLSGVVPDGFGLVVHTTVGEIVEVGQVGDVGEGAPGG